MGNRYILQLTYTIAITMKNNVIEQFLSQYSKEGTKKAYNTQLKNYFRIIKADPNTYFSNGRNYKNDFDKFWEVYKERPPFTRDVAIASVKMLFEDNIDSTTYHKQFPLNYWRKLRKRAEGNKALTQDKIPTPEELKEILYYSNIQGKALFLVLATSGMRVNEALHITLDDIHLNERPGRIDIPGNITKNGNPRTVFITDEAKNSLKAFLKKRESYYFSKACDKNKKKTIDDRVFPFHYQTAWLMWQTLIKHAEKNKRDRATKRYKYHIHVLRKYFRSRMGNKNGIGVDMTEFLMGHEGYLTRQYRHYTVEELGKEYLKGADRLLVFETPADTSDIREALERKDREIAELKADMEKLMRHIYMESIDKKKD